MGNVIEWLVCWPLATINLIICGTTLARCKLQWWTLNTAPPKDLFWSATYENRHQAGPTFVLKRTWEERRWMDIACQGKKPRGFFLFFGFQASAYLNPHESMTQSYAKRYTYIWMGTIVEVMCSTPSVIFFNLIFLFLREEHWLHSLEWGSHTWMIEHVFAISSGFYDFLGFFFVISSI